MDEKKNNKEIIKNSWRDFETIAFEAIKKSLLCTEAEIIEKKITVASHDGGYDGEFIIKTDNKKSHILFEAKLRSNFNASLPLQDFAKTLIISIVEQADKVFIATNLRFSDNVINILGKYQNCTSVEIELYNGKTIKNFISENTEYITELVKNNIDLINFLTASDIVFEEQALIKHNNSGHSITTNYRAFDKLLIVKGDTGSGKSFFIKNTLLNSDDCLSNIIIDVSKFLTYKEFFLKLLETTFGLSLELVDLIDEEAFGEAFSKIGDYTVEEGDLKVLKYVFSMENKIPYDYSVVFSSLVHFFNRIALASKNKIKKIAFLNVVYAQKEVLQLLLYFLKEQKCYSYIVEIAEDEYWLKEYEYWYSIKQNIYRLNHKSINIKNWTILDADDYLQTNICGLTVQERKALISKFGYKPSELSKLVELINYSNLYETSPKELIFNEILSLESDNNYILCEKCLEYAQLVNSDCLYVFGMFYFLDTDVNVGLVYDFFKNNSRSEKCFAALKNCSFIEFSGTEIIITDKNSKNCLDRYCENHLFRNSAGIVSQFIEEHLDSLHLTSEQVLEFECKKSFYENSNNYVSFLIDLGKRYLSMGLLKLAEERFNKALHTLNINPRVTISDTQQLMLHLGIIESVMWQIGQFKRLIEDKLKIAEDIILNSKISSNYFNLLKLNYFVLATRYYHNQNNKQRAYETAKQGVNFLKANDLYDLDIELCGRMWRFYAITVKEKYKNIQSCLKIFEQGKKYCSNSANFQLGYIVHKNMTLDCPNIQKRMQAKLDNYTPLYKLEKKLSIDEYLHFRINVAALNFILKNYKEAWKMYEKLLKDSVVFNILREKIRILNDMANINRLQKNFTEARKKYKTAKKEAEKGGCLVNYWQLLVNYCSFETDEKHFNTAKELHEILYPYMINACDEIASKQISFEQFEYRCAAVTLHICNLYKISMHYNDEALKNRIKYLWQKGNFFDKSECAVTAEKVKQMEDKFLSGSMFDHNGVYLFKD